MCLSEEVKLWETCIIGIWLSVGESVSEIIDPPKYTLTKLILIELQYTYLLTSQLEQQRKYFEQRMTQVEKSAQERVIWSLSLSLSSFVSAF